MIRQSQTILRSTLNRTKQSTWTWLRRWNSYHHLRHHFSLFDWSDLDSIGMAPAITPRSLSLRIPTSAVSYRSPVSPDNTYWNSLHVSRAAEGGLQCKLVHRSRSNCPPPGPDGIRNKSIQCDRLWTIELHTTYLLLGTNTNINFIDPPGPDYLLTVKCARILMVAAVAAGH